MDSSRILVAVADDHPVIRMGIEATLAGFPMLHLVGACHNSTELIALLDSKRCDVLVTDYAMPGGEYGDGLELLSFLKERYPSLAIVVMTGIDRSTIVQALLALGLENILSKLDDMNHLPAAIQAAHVRRRYLSPALTAASSTSRPRHTVAKLSPRELEVLLLYIGGASIKDIASFFQTSKQTVSTQKVNGMAKLGIEKDADLFKHAAELGLVGRTLGPERGGKA
ncbi:response regulator transcription factor [Dyella japonica]|uniref:Two-component system capsular synthesis response regulator RcsB n=1 Tax=Dyella japonica TaxID=231455 RepID=A0ABV2K119_9GAMM